MQEISGSYVNALFNANKQDYAANDRVRWPNVPNCDVLLGERTPGAATRNLNRD